MVYTHTLLQSKKNTSWDQIIFEGISPILALAQYCQTKEGESKGMPLQHPDSWLEGRKEVEPFVTVMA